MAPIPDPEHEEEFIDHLLPQPVPQYINVGGTTDASGDGDDGGLRPTKTCTPATRDLASHRRRSCDDAVILTESRDDQHTTKREKRVTFSDTPFIKLIKKVATCYKPSMWYNDSELDSFHRELEHDITMIKTLQRFINKDNYSKMAIRYAKRRLGSANTTPVGLEAHTSSIPEVEMSTRCENHCEAVLALQQLIRLGVVQDYPEELAKISRKKSKWFRRRAQIIGTLYAENTDSKTILLAGQELDDRGIVLAHMISK